MFPGQCGNTAFFFKSQPDQFHFEFRGIVFPGKSFFSAHEVSTCKISGCLSYRILDSGPDGTQTTLTLYLSQLLLKLQQHYHYLVEQIKDLESQLKRKLDEDEVGQRLLSIPCVGTLTASTISTEIGDGKQYASSRDFAAATGLVPRQYSTGGRTTLLGISKRGNKKIRTLLVQCARVFIQKLEHQSGKLADWVRELLCRKSNFVVTCALANKLARIAWALTARQQTYEA